MTPRRRLIAGNWKMNKDTCAAAILAQDILNRTDPWYAEDMDIVLCPPFTDLKTVRTVLEYDRSEINLGAQDVFWEAEGAYTGAISVAMLQELNCCYCIIGHSERRQYFHEDAAVIARKLVALDKAAIKAILCVGEGAEIRAGGPGPAEAYVVGQLRDVLDAADLTTPENLVVAYEPIWSIGTGQTATPESAESMAAALRALLSERFGADLAARLRILYGGSLKPENATFFTDLGDIDGGLVGGASLVAEDFVALIKAWK